MEEKKELIYTSEQIELLSPELLRGESGQTDTVPPQPIPPTPRRRGLTGLMVGVAVFAMAFLLCDGVYSLRQTAAGDGASAWLSQLFSNSFTQVTGTPAVSNQPILGTTSASASESTAGPVDTAPAETAAPLPTLTPEELYTYDLNAVPSGMIPIVPMDLSLSNYGESFHYNDTSYQLSLGGLAAEGEAIPTAAEAGEVSVLILHTHATEGYTAEGAVWYDPSTTLARADDPATGVVAVGEVMEKILNERGIVTLHSTVLHDAESYKDSYSRAAQTVQSYLEKYPSIRLVIDVHRDSILTSKDQLVRPVTAVNGEAVAQVMCVVGSDAAGVRHERWQENLALAVRLRNELNSVYGNLCRPVYVKKSAYNQQYAPASLLLEIGSSGNTLEEAQRAAALVAEQIAQMMGE